MFGKLASAARGGRNIAGSGGVSLKGLKTKGSSVRAQVARRPKAPSPEIPSTKPTGSMAGYEGGRSTYIQPNTSGYGHVKPDARPSMPGLGKSPAMKSGSIGMGLGNQKFDLRASKSNTFNR